MKDFRGKRVLITGGASGIGKLMGEAALRKGAELIIWDINEQGTVTAVAELSKLGRVMSQIVDISDTKSVMQAAELVKNNGGTPDLLINNAGIVPGNRYFHEHTHDDIDRTMNINALAAMHLTLAFLPDMIARKLGARLQHRLLGRTGFQSAHDSICSQQMGNHRMERQPAH